MNFLAKKLKKKEQLSPVEVSTLNHFLATLFEKSPYNESVRSRVDDADYIMSAMSELVAFLSTDSKFDIRILRRYLKDPNISDAVFRGIYRKEKSELATEDKIVNYICARIAQELMYDNFIGSLYPLTLRGMTEAQKDAFEAQDPEAVKIAVKNKLKELISANQEIQATFNTLCKVIKSVLETQQT